MDCPTYPKGDPVYRSPLLQHIAECAHESGEEMFETFSCPHWAIFEIGPHSHLIELDYNEGRCHWQAWVHGIGSVIEFSLEAALERMVERLQGERTAEICLSDLGLDAAINHCSAIVAVPDADPDTRTQYRHALQSLRNRKREQDFNRRHQLGEFAPAYRKADTFADEDHEALCLREERPV